MNLQIVPIPTQGEISAYLLTNSDEHAALHAATDAIADITAHYGFAPPWDATEHYALMASIFTEPAPSAAIPAAA